MLQTANHWTKRMNWSFPARRSVESRQYRRRTIRNKVVRSSVGASGRPKGQVTAAAVTKRMKPSALNLLSLKHDTIGHIQLQLASNRNRTQIA